MSIFSTTVENELSKQIILQVNNAIDEAMTHVGALHSKDWWTTKDLLKRGWTREDLNRLAEAGVLVRIDRGGSGGFVYSTESICQYIKSISH